jgi:hypothetical protein
MWIWLTWLVSSSASSRVHRSVPYVMSALMICSALMYPGCVGTSNTCTQEHQIISPRVAKRGERRDRTKKTPDHKPAAAEYGEQRGDVSEGREYVGSGRGDDVMPCRP